MLEDLLLESFGCWFKLDNSSKNLENENEKSLAFDLHVNFWFLEEFIKNPYLDIGIKINNYKKLENVSFSFPFQLQESNIMDLAPMMSTKSNASIVFNEECEVETRREYTIVQIPKKEGNDKLLIFPLKLYLS